MILALDITSLIKHSLMSIYFNLSWNILFLICIALCLTQNTVIMSFLCMSSLKKSLSHIPSFTSSTLSEPAFQLTEFLNVINIYSVIGFLLSTNPVKSEST